MDDCQPTDEEIVKLQYIADADRCAFGLGYEYARRGIAADDNPFPAGHWKHSDFYAGWKAYCKMRAAR